MLRNFQTTKAPTIASSSPSFDGADWSNPNRILVDDGSSATLGFFSGGDDGALIAGSSFGFNFPPGAVIDGILVSIDGSNTGCYGDVGIGLPGTTVKDMGSLNTTYGGPTDLWGATEIDPADIISSLTVSNYSGDVSGGDGVASMDYMAVTVYWHIDLEAAPADIPTRIAYKVYSRNGQYLGELPSVTSKFGFSQDINSAGSSIEISCGVDTENEVTVDPLLTESDLPIQTEGNLDILATSTEVLVQEAESPDDAMFKNSNRIKIYIYNYWYPNGKIVFSGQVNRVNFKYGSPNGGVRLLVISDGIDLNNYISRGYPFSLTNDVSQTLSGDSKTLISSSVNGSWDFYGQSFRTGVAVNNVAAITVRLNGAANVTVNLYNSVNGDLLGSAKRSIATSGWENPRFDFTQLIPVSPSTEYFFEVRVDAGQSILIANSATSVYPNGEMYRSNYSGGSGGGSFAPSTGDLYFVTASGVPTTTVTYTTDDPVTEMFAGILADYNQRGGYITERDFVATGLALTYTFNMATVFEALQKVIELSPTGYYSYVDLGTAEIDIQPVNETADFTVVRGKDISELDLSLSIEQVENYLLLTGGEVTPGVNLYRDYQDSESSGYYGLRTDTKSDNRIILAATADAIGETFIEENSGEIQETSLSVLNEHMDISLLVPGKTIGFRNFGNFIDNLVLQIVRREYTPEAVKLTIGRLPVRMNDEIERIKQELKYEQTESNPTAPS